tara:strand:- start:269 stop:436 length:168 start_codon:yes stop_codon:yes gene_type:complete
MSFNSYLKKKINLEKFLKEILLFIILIAFTFSCGKKAEPEYKESNYKYINQKNII